MSAEPNATTCVDCQMGYYQASAGQASCLPCLAGEFGNKMGLHSCSKCPKGKMNADQNATTCLDCNTGRFSNTNGSATCTKCRTGRYANANASKTCHTCPRGWIQEDEGQAGCTTPLGAPLLWADLPLSTYLEVGRLWIATNMTCASALDPVLLVRTTTGSDLAFRVRQAGQVSKDKKSAIRATRESTRKSREVCAWTVLRDGSRINPPKQA